ncbi:MAG: carbon-nitrogen hydrolase [Planctomycetota bacterium]|nr:MAG: carbon-nitrogen hydrolase [Planctomycetota bacterium]
MPEAKDLRVSCLQWDIRKGQVAHNLRVATELIEEASDGGTRLCVLPELWSSSFMGSDTASVQGEVEDAHEEIRQLSRDLNVCIVGSGNELLADGKLYNRAHVYDKGELLGSYRKIHLFTPLGEERWFKSGSDALILDTEFARLGVAICYDLRFPELIRHLYQQGAEIIVIPAQWPDVRAAHWRLLNRARAVENQCFVAASNRCGLDPSLVSGKDVKYPGNSILIDPTGEVLAQGNGEEGVVSADFELRQVQLIRRAIPVTKDRRDDIYAELNQKKSRLDPEA